MEIALLLVLLPLALVIHESGHAMAALALRLPCRAVLTRYGPGVRIGSDSIRLERWQVVVTAAAGPAANIGLAALAYRFGLPLLVLANIEFAVVNLLPLPHSDGSRMLRPARALARASGTANR